MRSRSKNIWHIFLVNRKYILGAILLSVILYGLAGTGGSESAEAGDQMGIEVKNEGSDQAALWDVILMRVTAYCWCWKCCGKHSDGITANGHRIRLRDTFVAADKMYSFGTEMVIPGYNNSQPVKVLDRGGAIHGRRLDVFFNSHQKAMEWGVQSLPVKVRAR
jgi:3D (Asp-Asp-Asp) domain-containing protein